MADITLKKAKIKVYRKPEETIICMFNPSEYKIATSSGYGKKKLVKKDSESKQYTGGGQSTLSLSLYYDMTENLGQLSQKEESKCSVRDYTDKIAGLLVMEGNIHAPPVIEFIWGDLSYKGNLTALNQEFTYFGMDGNPLRAKLDLTISGQLDSTDGRKSPKESPDRTKHRTISQETMLWKLAWDEYGDCEKWKEIAAYNHLMNPLDIKPGQVIKLPSISS